MKKYWDKIILAAIILAAATVRLYHFHDWLFFAMDQARDAMLVSKAYLEGISQLPLLGPRAAGTYLRLGPVFYYFQYAAAKIFRSVDPPVFAYPDLLFSVLSIPLLYFFLRLYFEKFTSLLATAVYAFGFVAVQYSRFAWNPNSVPFWILVCFYGLLRFSAEEGRKKYAWLAAAAAGLAVVSQLHFMAFLAVPIIMLLYLFVTKNFARVGWRGLGLAALVVAFFYVPMIFSEISTGGDNVRQFVFALSSKPQEQSFRANFVQNAVMHGKYYFLFLSSYVSRSFFPSVIAGLVLIAGGVAVAAANFFKETDGDRKNFLALVLIWPAVSFLVLIPFAFNDQPRFFFLEMAVPFVFFSLWVGEFLKMKKWRRAVYFLAAAAAIFLVGLNLEATSAWFRALATASRPQAVRGRVLEIKQTESLGFTLSQVEAVSDYLYGEWKKRGRKINISANMSYRVPVQYLLEKKDPPADYGIIGRKDRDRGALYFSIRLTDKKTRLISRRLEDKFDLSGEREFGALTVYELNLRDVQPAIKKQKKESDPDAPKKPKARRKERVLWENIF